MVKVDSMQLKNDYKIAQDLMKTNKYIQAVLHLENVLKRTYDDSDKDILKNIYKDIIFSYRAINNKTRADYYFTKAVGIFGSIDETDENLLTNELSAENKDITNSNTELGEIGVLRTINDFEILKKPYKITANDTNEMNFNNIFVEIFTAVESKKYFGYFKLNLNKLSDVLEKGIDNLNKEEINRLKWETKSLLSLIDNNGITSFDSLYKLEFELNFSENQEESLSESEEYSAVTFDGNDSFDFEEQLPSDLALENSYDEHEEIKKGIDRIVEKNREIFEEHNSILNVDPDYSSPSGKTSEVEIISMDEKVLDLNMEDFSELPKTAPNETIIVEINTDKVRENNLEVSKVKDVVLEVLENLRKSDLDIFTELKIQSQERAEKIGLEREKKGLLSGLEGMLEIKFGVASLDIVPEIKKINELERLYEVKEKVLATRSFTEVEKLITGSTQQEI